MSVTSNKSVTIPLYTNPFFYHILFEFPTSLCMIFYQHTLPLSFNCNDAHNYGISIGCTQLMLSIVSYIVLHDNIKSQRAQIIALSLFIQHSLNCIQVLYMCIMSQHNNNNNTMLLSIFVHSLITYCCIQYIKQYEWRYNNK